MIPESTLLKLIEIGNSIEWDDPALLSRLSEIKNDDHINRLHWKEWYATTDKLTIDQIECLVKGLVAAEEKLKWIGGSVSAVIWVFRALERRDENIGHRVGVVRDEGRGRCERDEVSYHGRRFDRFGIIDLGAASSGGIEHLHKFAG